MAVNALDHVVGHAVNVAILRRAINQGKLPNRMLFTGPTGVGKTTTAKAVAEELELELTPVETFEFDALGSYKFALVPDAHLAADDVLLRAASNPYIVLETSKPHLLPDSVKTRFIEFRFSPIPGDEIIAALLSEEPDLDEQAAALIAARAQGNLAHAYNLLEKVRLGEPVETLRRDLGLSLLNVVFSGSMDAVFSVVTQAYAEGSSADELASELIGAVRNLIVVKTDATGSSLLAKSLASQVTQDQLIVVARVLWELRVQLRASVDARGSLELALTLLTSSFAKQQASRPDGATVAVKSESSAEKPKLTLDELRLS